MAQRPASSTTSQSSSSAASTPAPAVSTSGAAAPKPLASIFSFSLAGTELLNPCIAVNGLDGLCTVGTATDGLSALALSPDGKQLYGAAPAGRAIDVFTPDATGALSQTGCVMVDAPPGLCSSGGSLEHPFALAVSPDGTNVYAASGPTMKLVGDQLDVLTRNATTGALSGSGCVVYEEPPRPKEEEDEEEAEDASASTAAAGGCTGAPAIRNLSVLAVSGDSSSVYAIGDGSAAIFSRNPTSGQLTEASCADSDDSRCTSLPALEGVSGAAVSPDGRQVYVAASESGAVMVFGVGAAVTTGHASATHAGAAIVSVACPASLHRACSGRLGLTRTLTRDAGRDRRHARVRRVKAGHSGTFSIAPGRHARVRVKLTPATRRLLHSHRKLRLMAVVHAASAGGGSGYGHRVTFRLAGA